MALIPKSIATGAAAGLAGKAIASLFKSKNPLGPDGATTPEFIQQKDKVRKAVDFRARLSIKPSDYDRILSGVKNDTGPMMSSLPSGSQQEVLGPKSIDNILLPLYNTLGVLFPYTPTVSFGNTANYTELAISQSNYKQWAYAGSNPNSITITALFTAQTDEEARYMLAVWHFFNVATKSYFGRNPADKRGTPPPVLLFNYLGDQVFKDVPVIIKETSHTFDNVVNYVPVPIGDKVSYMPTEITFTITMEIQQNPNRVANEFNLDEFRTGALLGKGFV